MSSTRVRLDEIRRRIAGAGGTEVKVVAVTKGHGPGAVAAALEAGLTDVGENFAAELLAKHIEAAADTLTTNAACQWHFLGRVQRNKVAKLAPVVDVWQGVDRVEAGREIARRAPGARVLVQVNLAGDPKRPGCRFDEAPTIIDVLRTMDLDVAGVSGVAPKGGRDVARPGFRRLAELARANGLRECSMGMTDDLEVAVEEGATMVRIGRGLFGPRMARSGPISTSGADSLQAPREA